MIKIQEVSTPGCAHCAEARRLLEQEIKQQFPNVDIEFIDMLSPEGQKLVQEYGIMASPGIIVNGELFSMGKLNKQKLIGKIQSLQHVQ
jgi:glutaredoxin